MSISKNLHYFKRYALKKQLVFRANPVLFVVFFLLFSFLNPTTLSAQSAETLYQQAHTFAVNQQYDTAIVILKQASKLQPRDADMQLYLARVYAWKKDFDNAQYTTFLILEKQPQNQDALLLLADIYLWSKQWDKLENLVQKTLYPETPFQSVDTIAFIKKYASGLIEQARYQEAEKLLFPVRGRLYATWDFVKTKLISNALSVHYAYFDFKTQQTDWQVVEVDYSKKLRSMTFIGSLNYANRFERQGYQVMAQAYPKISKHMYAWLLAGVSDGKTFPDLVYGGSFFTSIKKYWEFEAGIRFFKVKDSEKATILRGGIAYQNKQHRLTYNLAKISGTGISGLNHSLAYQNYFCTKNPLAKHTESYLRLGIGTGTNSQNFFLSPQYDNFIINSLVTNVSIKYQINRNWSILGGCSLERNKNQTFDNKQSRWIFDTALAYKF